MDRHSARFIDAEELAALTGVSKAGAYKIIQQLNEELKQKGVLKQRWMPKIMRLILLK